MKGLGYSDISAITATAPPIVIAVLPTNAVLSQKYTFEYEEERAPRWNMPTALASKVVLPLKLTVQLQKM